MAARIYLYVNSWGAKDFVEKDVYTFQSCILQTRGMFSQTYVQQKPLVNGPEQN